MVVEVTEHAVDIEAVVCLTLYHALVLVAMGADGFPLNLDCLFHPLVFIHTQILYRITGQVNTLTILPNPLAVGQKVYVGQNPGAPTPGFCEGRLTAKLLMPLPAD